MNSTTKMTELSKKENVMSIWSENQSPGALDCPQDKFSEKTPVSEQTNNQTYVRMKSESFVVDMERLSHLTNKDMTANSRTTLQRSLSRKGSARSNNDQIENKKKILMSSNNINGNERDHTNNIVSTSPPKAKESLVGGTGMPEKSKVVIVPDQNGNPPARHLITIMTCKATTTNIASTVESKCSGTRRFSFRRPSPSWTIDPRRILFLFATLSSMGTIVLIYFTLSMRKRMVDEV